MNRRTFLKTVPAFTMLASTVSSFAKESGICIIHRDTRLIGCNLFDYRDIYGQYVFKRVGEQNVGYLTWIDDFDADRFNPKGNFSEYTKAGTSEPTRLNFAVYHFFEPWSCYILVEAHHKITK